MIKNILLVTSILTISACASTSMYVAKEDSKPHGYYESETNQNTFLVTYETYKPIEKDQLFKFVLKRSAELAKERGFISFKVLTQNEEVVTELIEVPEVIGVISNGQSPSMMNTGLQTGVIVPAYTKAFNIKKSHAEIELSNITSGPNIYLANDQF